MESRLEETLKALKDQMAQYDQTLTNINAKLDHTKPKYEEPYQVHPNPRRAPCQNPGFEPNPSRPNPELVDQDERAMRNIRLEAPTFDGSLDPKVYIDWEGDMDQYFEWYEMTEERKFKFAKLKLIWQARLYWENIERLARYQGEIFIATWRDMKTRLREKYLPASYHQRLLDQWQRLSQGNKMVSEYIAKFDEFITRYNMDESETVTLSRFRAGLWENIMRELFLREVNDLEHAYQIARDCERFQRGPTKITTPNPKPGSSQTNPGRPNPSTPMTHKEDKGKAPEI